MQGFEYHQLKCHAHQEEPDRSSQDLGNEEEPCSGLVGCRPEPFIQVLVDGYHVHPEQDRSQHEGDYDITYEEAQDHLHVSHCRSTQADHPGYRDVGHS